VEELGPNDPKEISSFRILGRLGKGGMGRVYFAIDTRKKVDNEVALKIIRNSALEEPGSRARLQREVNALNQLNSPFIARITDSNIESTPAWIATEKINGPSLSDFVKQYGPLDEKNWYSLAYGLFSALSEIHRNGIIHRDIKPSNILVETLMNQLVPKIIDFGISLDNDSTSLTRTGVLVGTPAWLAPEQFTGNQLSSSVDVFAAASTLHFAATGKNPWGIEDTTPIATVIGVITNGSADLSELDDERRELLTNLLDNDPSIRVSADGALKHIYKIIKSKSIPFIELTPPPEGSPESLRSLKKKKHSKRPKKKLKSLSLVGLLLLLVSAIFITVESSEPVEASIVIGITSDYFDNSCKGISGMTGIENSKVSIEDSGNQAKFTIGRLNLGLRTSSSSCKFIFKFPQFNPDHFRYKLEIEFPWDLYSENFQFKSEADGQYIYSLNLLLE
jgi:serine/threonine protein kinase